ncbi:acyl-CoA dehydrogenase family protein [Nocardia cyriacigeorgica]|uniref:acyl-CoA dehydrogenase family protein n=1 Tax=Nocardia cyriacigeorgica TaxID=135487 RepID=UPI001895C48D|nr:acyl-CoA dehydrogenase family protein [Nocardia cyriacigeorgica]MBF6399453.1 acyl-CoA dehydrogenase family protein [Nocardia cyriacigeorgica]MBF6405083.1 acyl-CoA dehydrogenase family protein [Nocardia cyriacigeorgica]
MTITSDTHTTPASNLLNRIDDIGALITSSQPEALRLRRTTDQVVDALEGAGVTRMTWPRERGGDQLSLLDQHTILTEIGRHDGSTAWLTATWAATPWMIRLFGEEVFDEYLTSPMSRNRDQFRLPIEQCQQGGPDWQRTDHEPLTRTHPPSHPSRCGGLWTTA